MLIRLPMLMAGVGALVATGTALSAAPPQRNGDVVVLARHVALPDNQRAVPYGDLAHNTAGHRTLIKRVAYAINAMCDPSAFSVSDPAGSLKCNQQAWTDVRPQLDQLLTAR